MNLTRFRSLKFIFLVLFVGLMASCADSPEKTLEKIVNDTNIGLPQIMDEYTTMTNCELLEDRTLKFTYTVKDVLYNFLQKSEMEKAMKQVLIERLKARKELEFYLVNNVRFEHVFLDANSREVMHVNIESLDYK